MRKVKEKDLPFPLLSPHAGGPPILYSLLRRKDRRGKLFYDIVRIDKERYGEFVCGFRRAAMAGWALGELNRGGTHEQEALARFEGKRNHGKEEEPKRKVSPAPRSFAHLDSQPVADD